MEVMKVVGFWFIREDSEYFKMDGEEFIGMRRLIRVMIGVMKSGVSG